jgi:3-methyladenine DNA glycosylase/8-oxoguanine DNA glycosylase
MKYNLEIPSNYSLRSVLLSHGWSGLAPFIVSDNHHSIQFVFSGSKSALLTLTQKKNIITIQSTRKLLAKEIETVRKMFGLDLEMKPFFDLANMHDRTWIRDHHMGRLLRAQTVFEDVIKLILTTNCTWSLTKKMVQDLCTQLGQKVGDFYSFPKPTDMAEKNETYFRNVVKTGYRAPFIVQISKMVANGKLDIESWATDERPYAVLRKDILALPGAGPYVAENLLRYLGKYDGLGVDSWVRGRLQQMWNMKKQPNDKKILQRYKNYGEYKGLILWCDVTKDWHVTENESSRVSKVSA